MKLAFCCTGNTCRSPMAQFIMISELRSLGVEGVEVGSFGLFASGGMPISENSAAALKELGVPFDIRRAVQVTPVLFAECDYVFAMTDGHKRALIEAFGGEDKVFTLSEASDTTGDIADPYGGSRADYLRCAEEIRRKVSLIALKIQDMTAK